MKEVFRLGELFCGPGGLAWGAITAQNEKFKIVHQWANDFDVQTCKTYARNICPDSPDSVIYGDVRELDLKNLGAIDALDFGYRCNDFSVVGEQTGLSGPYGPIFPYGVSILKIYKPKWFLAENVGGLKSANEGKAFTLILSEMKKAGYRIYPNLYHFEEYGVPQARHRVIIVGIRKDLPFKFEIPSPEEYKTRTCKDAIENPPIPSNAANNELTKQSLLVIERLKHIKPGENAWTANLPEELKLNVSGAKISQIYKRLDPTKPAYTVTGSGGGGTHIYHYSENRALTNRERARLQTFPDNFVFEGNKESVRKQIGMAVPPEGARIIFEAILKTFSGDPYKSTPSNIDF
ncbi:MAG: DNA cytosine methyltransferase [Muribaculaceae bacterium]|nr:DNA cytosine methyltransferase [Muribaculaceae bacterium]